MFESFAVAVSCRVAPTDTVPVFGETLAVATICRDHTSDVSAFPPAVAMIRTHPLPVLVTRPLWFTVTRATLTLDQAKVTPVSTLPPASRATALNGAVKPIALMVSLAGVTLTEAMVAAMVAALGAAGGRGASGRSDPQPARERVESAMNTALARHAATERMVRAGR